MTDRELMQQALSALNQASPSGWSMDSTKRHYGTIEALRARLAQPEQEPVAYITTWNEKEDAGVELHWAKQDKGLSSKHTPLYYAPQREWQGLTDEEIEKLVYDIRSQTTGVVATAYVARAIEAKLKEKNNAA